MAQKVISFRCDDDMTRELESRKLPGESIMLTAQRILREALGLGVIGEQARRVEDIVDDTVAPLQQEIEELRAKLGEVERWVNNLNDCASQDVPSLKNDVWVLKQMVFDCSEPLVKRVEQLEKHILLEVPKEITTEDNLVAPATKTDTVKRNTPTNILKLRCKKCGYIGIVGKEWGTDFRKGNMRKRERMYICPKCEHGSTRHIVID